ncbi:MAG: hypothetical protein AB7S92_09245 [Parvibaculaceae bacterium]|jgi:hypothetical protein
MTLGDVAARSGQKPAGHARLRAAQAGRPVPSGLPIFDLREAGADERAIFTIPGPS